MTRGYKLNTMNIFTHAKASSEVFRFTTTKRSQTAFYYIFQSITVQFSTVSILHPAHRVTPTDWNEIQKVKRYVRVQSAIILMEREKEIHLGWFAFSLVATHEYITFNVHHCRNKNKSENMSQP